MELKKLGEKVEGYKLSCIIGNVNFGVRNMVRGAMSCRGVGKITFINIVINVAMCTDILK